MSGPLRISAGFTAPDANSSRLLDGGLMSDTALAGRWVLAFCIGAFFLALVVTAFLMALVMGEHAHAPAYLGGTASGLYAGVLLGASRLPPAHHKTAVLVLSVAMGMFVALSVLGNLMLQHADRAMYEIGGGVIGFIWLSQRDRLKPRPLVFDDEQISEPIDPRPDAPAVAAPLASPATRRSSTPKSFGKRR